MTRRNIGALAALAAAAAALPSAAHAQPASAHGADGGDQAPAVSLVDTIAIPAGTTQLGLPFGGLSGIDYDPDSGRYVAISDDRSENAPARFYTLRLPLDDDGFADGAPTFESATTLLTVDGTPFPRRTLDPEAIRWSSSGDVLWTSEGAANTGQAAFVREAAASGAHVRELTLPDAYRPVLGDGRLTAGVRDNQALESLTLSRDGTKVVTAVENALVQDGPAAGLNAKSPSRVLLIDRETGRPTDEYVYEVDPIASAPTAPLSPPINTYSADRGLSELLAVNKTDYLAVERSFASGVGFQIKIYWTTTRGADDVHGKRALDGTEAAMRKRLLFDFDSTSVAPDNVEGITWGPRLPDGARSLVLVADDNFGFNGSVTKFHLLRVPRGALAPRRGLRDDDRITNLQLLSFNDFHGNLDPPSGRDGTLGRALDPSNTPVGGVEYLASTLRQLRTGVPDTLTVAAGDLIGASPFLSGLFHDEPTIESMEALHLDVTSVGNHEFDEGVDELLRIQHGGCHPVDGCYMPDHPFDGSAFPWLAANVVDKVTREPILAPTWVKDVDGIPVGFIGMTLEGTPGVTGQSGIQTVDFLDEVETANAAAAKLTAQGVRAIVVLLHEGGIQAGSYGQCNGISGPVVAIARGLDPTIDAVVTGHTHQPYICSIPDPAGQPRSVTSASSFGRVVTEARVPLDRVTGDVVRSGVQAMNHLISRTRGKDPVQTAIIDRWRALSAPIANRVVGSITADITRSETRDAESDLANLIADAQLAATAAPERGGAQIAFMNPGGVRADLTYAASAAGEAPGEITYAEAFAVQPFSGSIVSVDLTGRQIEQILEQQFNDSGTRAPTLILGVSKGFRYAYSASRPVGDRVDPTSITLDGDVLDPAATYRVTANTFLADGGDGFTTFAEGRNRVGGGDDIATLVDYLGANSPVPPPGTDRAIELP